MSDGPKAQPATSNGRRRSKRWEVWAALALALLVCAATALLHLSHQNQLRRMAERMDTLRQSRMDIAKGFLTFTLSEEPGSPFRREQGLALIGQGLPAYEQAAGQIAAWSSAPGQTLSEQDLALLHEGGQALLASLVTQRGGPPRRGGTTAQRIAYHKLEQQIEDIEAVARRQRHLLRSALTREFALALTLCGLLFLGAGASVALAGRARDRLEAERDALAERHGITLRSIGDGVLVTDAQGRVELLNPVAEAATGWTLAEARGRPLSEVFPLCNGSTRAPVESPVAHVLRQGQKVELANDTLLLARDGRELPIADSAAPLHNAQGDMLGVVLVFRDQTREKQLKQELRESELHFRTLANNGQALIWTSGLDMGCYYFNEPWLRFTGRSLEQEQGNGWAEGVHPEDYDRCLEIYVSAFARREAFSMEYRLRHVSGEYRWIVDQGTPRYDSSGAFAGFIGHCLDVHDIKAAEEELRKLSMAVQQSPAAIVITDLQGRIEYVNPRFEEITGYSADEALGQRADFLSVEEQNLERNTAMWSALAAGQDWSGEFHNRRKDGSPYWEQAAISTVRDEQGRPSHYLAIKDDITERKAMNEALKGSEERFRRIVETAEEGIWSMDQHGCTTYANRTMAEMLGCSVEEMLGRSVTEFRFPEDFAAFQERLLTRSQGRGERYEQRLRSADGGEVWALVSASPIFGPGGEFQGSFAMVSNITERKRIQQLMEARLRLGRIAGDGGLDEILSAAVEAAEAITMSVIGFVHFVDEDGDTLSLQQWSPGTRAQCSAPDKNQRYPLCKAGVWAEALRTGRPAIHNDYASMLGKRGLPPGHVPVTRELVVPVMDKGRLVALMGVGNKPIDYSATDVDTLSTLASLAWEVVTRRRAQDALLRSKELAEAAAKAKSEFLANMSHEIRTPLNGVLGMLQLLQGGAAPEEQARYTAMALDAGRRLLSLLNDILDFSRLEAGDHALRREPLRLREVCQGVVNVLGFVSQAKGLSLGLDMDASVPDLLLGDEARLRQILFNLAGNSIKFTPAGSVRLSAWARPSQARPGVLHLHVSVSDTGVGIKDEMLDQIFERFTQSDSSYARGFEGAGLGLAIVRRIVSLMGGTICVDSTLGQGTSIHVSLPLALAGEAQQQAALQREAAADEPPATTLRVLVVEDDEISRMAIRVMLQRLGHACTAVGGGEQALEALRAQDFDCVLMDIQMPGMDGLEATRSIRAMQELGPRAQLPVLALTAYAMPGDRERFLEAGMDDHVPKPVQMEELAQALRRVASRLAAARSRSGAGAATQPEA